MKIKTLFKTIFCAGLVLTLVLYLCHLYGNYIEKTQEPITGYTYNGFEEKSNYKSSNTILITYKSKQYVLHTGDRVLDKIKSGDFPKLYYSSKTDYLFFEGDYLPVNGRSATVKVQSDEAYEGSNAVLCTGRTANWNGISFDVSRLLILCSRRFS